MTYSEHFINNFYLSFITSLSFIIYFFVKSALIDQFIKINKIDIFGEFSKIIIFFLQLSFYTAVFNILLIFNSLYLIKYLLLISFLLTLYFFYYVYKKKEIINMGLKLKNFKKKHIIFLLILPLLFLISILPLSDADSIAYHLNFPFRLLAESHLFSDIQKNIEFSMIANNEILLSISVLLKSDNFGSILNFFVLIVFMYTQKDSRHFKSIILSCPLLIFLISTQKLQMTFSILFLILFINIYEKKLKNNLEIFIVCMLLVFYASIKTSYILISLPLFIYFLYNYNFKAIKIIIFSSIGVLLFFVPLFFIKYNAYGNIFSPFFDNYLGSNKESLKALQYSLRTTEGWLTNYADYKTFLKIFVPTNFSQLSATFGLLFLILFFNYNLLKKLHFFPLIIFFMILITGQISPRYYLEAFLILAYYLPRMNFPTKVIVYAQLTIVFIFSAAFVYTAYDGFLKKNFKNKYQNKFAFSYYNAEQIKKIDFKKKNVLTFADGRQSIFYEENFYSQRYLSVLSSYNKNSKFENLLPKYINNNNIEYIIHTNLKNANCFDNKKNGYLNQKIAVRNFLIKNNFIKYNIYKIENIENCKN
jgi:hypothetical protein